METHRQERSLLAQIFISPDEPRLRAGWRLLIHTFLLIILFLIVFVGLFSVIFALDAVGAINLAGVDISGGAVDTENLPAWLTTASVVGALIVYTAATWIARRFLDRRSFASLGLHITPHMAGDVVFGIALGGLLMGLIYAFETAMGWLTFEAWAWEIQPGSAVISGLIGATILYLAVGYQEELLSRGYHLQNLWAGLNLPLALVISSGVFALLHVFNPGASWISTLGIFFAGFFLAYGYLRTAELWIPIGLHIGWNFFQGTIFGFPVSGTGGFHLIQQSVEGPAVITGGAFGPEAGLLSWVAMLVGIGLMWLYTRGRTTPVSSKEDAPVAETPVKEPA